MTPQRPRMIRRKQAYRGRVFHIEQDTVALGGSRIVRMDAVRHPGSVVLIPQPSPQEVILIRQFRYVIDQWIWELPAGTLEPGEAPARAARRECEEEIGLRPGKLERLGAFYPSPGFCDERMVFFKCSALIRPKTPLAGDPDEQIEPKSFTIADVWDLVAAGKVVDMKTIVGLTLLERRTAPK